MFAGCNAQLHQKAPPELHPLVAGPMSSAPGCVWPVGSPPAQDAATVPFAVLQPPFMTQGCSLCLWVPPHACSNPGSSVSLCIHSSGELLPFHATLQSPSRLDGKLHPAPGMGCGTWLGSDLPW